MPEIYMNIVNAEGLERGVADYIAGMSDDYCLLLFNKLFVPKLVIDQRSVVLKSKMKRGVLTKRKNYYY